MGSANKNHKAGKPPTPKKDLPEGNPELPGERNPADPVPAKVIQLAVSMGPSGEIPGPLIGAPLGIVGPWVTGC